MLLRAEASAANELLRSGDDCINMAKTRYGTPYKGSKNTIAEWVVSNLPPAGTFVDLFAGGCAVTHAAMVSGKFKRFIANDLGEAPDVFKAAIDGEFEGYATVPTREEFFASDDPALRLMYSFGNDSKTFLWSKELERVKNPATRMVTAPSVYERKKAYNEFLRALRAYIEGGNGMPDSAGHDGALEGLQRLQGLERLQRLQGLQGLEIKHLDYRAVEIPSGSTVYADPPYRGTNNKAYGEHGDGFDFDAFDTWLSIAPFPVIVSEYTAPAGCTEIAAIEKRVHVAATDNTQRKTEHLFVQERFVDEYRERMGAQTLVEMEKTE